MFGAFPRHLQTAQGKPNGLVADEPWGKALGETDLGGQREGPPAGRLAERPRTLREEGSEGLAGPDIEDGRRGVRSRGERLQHGETPLVERMHGVADRLISTAELVCNRAG